MAATYVSLKLLIDVEGGSVLFAEAGKDFVDFLFNILSLPLGTVIRLLTEKGMVGSLGKLYHSIENLSDTYMQPNQNKDSILKPKASNSDVNVSLLMLPDVESSTSKKLYKCVNYMNNHNCRVYVADDPRANCPACNKPMSSPASYVNPPAGNNASSSEEGGFVKGVVTYMVMDDLMVKPMSTISSITMLNKFNIKDVGALEEKVIKLSMDEKFEHLLERSLELMLKFEHLLERSLELDSKVEPYDI